jgi:UDP-N-acetylglucosamine acyltransferase
VSETRIHPTALVDPAAELGPGVTVGPFSVIEAGVVVGAGTEIHSHVHLFGGTSLGRDNVVHAGVFLGGAPQDLAYRGAPTRAVIGDRNVFREGCTVHRGTDAGSETRIGDDCFFMANSHVAHNCVVADGVMLANGALLGGHVQIGDRAFVSGNAVVHQHVRVGRLAMLQGLSAASLDVPPFCVVSTGKNALAGVNVVGLRRAGVDGEGIAAVRRAYRALFYGRPNLRKARARLEQELAASGGSTPELEELFRFLDGGSRGVCSGEPLARRRSGAPSPGD